MNKTLSSSEAKAVKPPLFPPGTKVLIVDDVPEIRMILSLFLRHKGVEVLLATNTAEALETALKEQPDLVLLDMWLPDHDGYFATQGLRLNSFSGPIIAMT